MTVRRFFHRAALLVWVALVFALCAPLVAAVQTQEVGTSVFDKAAPAVVVVRAKGPAAELQGSGVAFRCGFTGSLGVFGVSSCNQAIAGSLRSQGLWGQVLQSSNCIIARPDPIDSSMMTATDKIALASMIVAALAFVTTIWQAYITRRHNILSVQPIIEHNYSLDYENTVTISIVNAGLGPALVSRLIFRDPESGNKLSIGDFIETFQASMNGQLFKYEAVKIDHTTILRAGEVLQLIGLHRYESELGVFARAVAQFDKHELEVEYKSMYGDVFKYREQTSGASLKSRRFQS